AQELQNDLREMPELAEKLTRAVVDDPPLALKEGGIFRDGYDVDLDALRQASREGKNWISQLQEREIGVTGIKSLKVRYNSVFGYFIEVTKSNLANVPGHYTHKQTTVGGERFITPELKEMEAKILGADERARQREYQLFQKLRDGAPGHHHRSEHGGKIHLHPSGRTDCVDGADWQLCSGRKRGDRPGRSHFHSRRRQ